VGKVKSSVMEQEDLFYTRADTIIKSCEYETEAVNTVIVLAEEMNLLSYLGGYDVVEDMVCDAWYDIQTSHVG